MRLDRFMSGLRDGSVLDDCDFELLARGKLVRLNHCVSLVHI